MTTLGVTFDTGALIALDRGDKRIISLLSRLEWNRARVSIPAGVLAQAWRNGRQQARLARLLDNEQTEEVPIDWKVARAVGIACGQFGVADVVDVSVVICARQRGDAVVTSDPDDLLQIDPKLRVFTV
jgi:hypothetical protein